MTIQEKIIFFEEEEKRLKEKAISYAKKGSIHSAKAQMVLVKGVRTTLELLKAEL